MKLARQDSSLAYNIDANTTIVNTVLALMPESGFLMDNSKSLNRKLTSLQSLSPS